MSTPYDPWGQQPDGGQGGQQPGWGGPPSGGQPAQPGWAGPPSGGQPAQPGWGGTDPYTQPGYGAQQPGYGTQQPGYGAPQPAYGAQPPGYGAPPPGGWNPPPGGGRSRAPLFVGLAVVLVLLIVGAVAIFSLTGDDDPVAQPSSTTRTTEETTTTRETTTTTEEDDSAGSVDAVIGDCLSLTGDTESASADVVDCAAPSATHIVIRVAVTQTECQADADATYFETRAGVEVFTLCLDVNWRPGICYDITKEGMPGEVDLSAARQVPCGPVPDREIVQFERRIDGATDVNDCTEGGFRYTERMFAICTITIE